jgi:hypothetical protein
MKKGAPYVWTSRTEVAFQVLKQGLVSTIVLALPEFSQTFIIETVACRKCGRSGDALL